MTNKNRIFHYEIGLCAKVANESNTIEKFTLELIDVLENQKISDFFIYYVVDQFSVDSTYELILKLQNYDSRIFVEKIYAKTLVDSDIYAYCAGIKKSPIWIGDINAGYRHNPSDLQKFIDEMRKSEADVIFGSRFLPGSKYTVKSKQRKILTILGGNLAKKVLKIDQTDLTSGFMFFKLEILEKIINSGLRSKYHFIQTEIKFKASILTKKIIEVPISYNSESNRLKASIIIDSLKILYYSWATRTKKKSV